MCAKHCQAYGEQAMAEIGGALRLGYSSLPDLVGIAAGRGRAP